MIVDEHSFGLVDRENEDDVGQDISDTIRWAINQSGERLPTIAKKSGVDLSALVEFMDGADLHLTTATKIASHLGLEFIVRAQEPAVDDKSQRKSSKKKSRPAT